MYLFLNSAILYCTRTYYSIYEDKLKFKQQTNKILVTTLIKITVGISLIRYEDGWQGLPDPAQIGFIYWVDGSKSSVRNTIQITGINKTLPEGNLVMDAAR